MSIVIYLSELAAIARLRPDDIRGQDVALRGFPTEAARSQPNAPKLFTVLSHVSEVTELPLDPEYLKPEEAEAILGYAKLHVLSGADQAADWETIKEAARLADGKFLCRTLGAVWVPEVDEVIGELTTELAQMLKEAAKNCVRFRTQKLSRAQ